MKIAIASGKGGTGKTLVSTNLFYSISKQNIKNCFLVDCDAEEPNDMIFFKGKVEKTFDVNQKVPVINESKCTYCGKCHEFCNYNAIFILPSAKIIKVIEDLCHGCGACSVACKFDAISEKEVSLGTISRFYFNKSSTIVEAKMKIGVMSPVPVIKAAVKETGNEGIIILDSPPGTSCPFIQTVATADYVILVTEPTPFGLSDLKQSVDTLKTMNKPCGVIINRSGLGGNEIYDYLNQCNIPILMEIPFDKEIASHYSKGELFVKYKKEWEQHFISMFNSIVEKYGNSSN
ncbi:MAG: ATP-binding protein [Bacteroidales bacterium]|jgi:MinD superfamily P-loop ATPase|nr:ATP-binding protein [Bacteroidales bacterium]HOL97631.1 ATP-binding protein [Bacteroidales bacterium]HOM37466.1 ATP-binding protein [Bacteroidales bacterium]HPD24367.1 ATP-binding protein [Bacteroidales bacterium]HRT00241.1 ATP-binding protein [Bacteroidales bacterium]